MAGVMLIRDLEQKFINSNVNAFIRGLLNKFEVAVEYDNQHLLIPSLLPKRNDAISIQMVRIPQPDDHIDEQVCKPLSGHFTSRFSVCYLLIKLLLKSFKE